MEIYERMFSRVLMCRLSRTMKHIVGSDFTDEPLYCRSVAYVQIMMRESFRAPFQDLEVPGCVTIASKEPCPRIVIHSVNLVPEIVKQTDRLRPDEARRTGYDDSSESHDIESLSKREFTHGRVRRDHTEEGKIREELLCKDVPPGLLPYSVLFAHSAVKFLTKARLRSWAMPDHHRYE